MPAQERQSKKNYIGIVCDNADEQRAIESLPRSDHFVKDYVRALMGVLWSSLPVRNCEPVTIRNYAGHEAAAIPRSDP